MTERATRKVVEAIVGPWQAIGMTWDSVSEERINHYVLAVVGVLSSLTETAPEHWSAQEPDLPGAYSPDADEEGLEED